MDGERQHSPGGDIQNAYVEIFAPSGPEVVILDGERYTVGKSEGNDIALPWDDTVSQLHAIIERYPTGWCVRDVGSRNGTMLNGDLLSGEHVLRAGDEVRAGATRLVFRLASIKEAAPATLAAESPPELTRREREVLVALCRPVFMRDLLSEPASVKKIAEELVITESAVKKHLGNLYDKFGIHETEGRRRGQLVADAVRRGAVTRSDFTTV
jgi:DNA-binding CsgD family transcriptional regulator